MKKINYFFVVLISAMLLTACNEKSTPITHVLDVKEKSVTLPSTENTKEIEIERNSKIYAVWQGASWGSVKVTNVGVLITVNQNTTIEQRNAEIMVMLDNGDLKEKITVTQLGSELALSTVPTEINFNMMDNEKKVLIFTDGDTWEATVEGENSDWLTVETNISDYSMVVKAAAADTNDKRTADVVVICGTLSKTIKVTQDGKMYLITPFCNFGEPIQNFVRMENDRLSVLTSASSRKQYTFTTKSSLFPQVMYITAPDAYSVESGMLTTSIANMNIFYSEQFLAFMQSQGFEVAYNNTRLKTIVFWNGEKSLQALSGGNRMMFRKIVEKPQDPDNQTVSYNTFGNFMFKYFNWTHEKAQIAEWEKANGGTEMNVPAGFVGYVVAENSDKLLARVYGIETVNTKPDYNKMYSVTNVYSDLHTALFRSSNSYHPTREFLEFMTSEGFTLSNTYSAGTTNANYDFKNTDKGLLVNVSVKDFLPHKECLFISLFAL